MEKNLTSQEDTRQQYIRLIVIMLEGMSDAELIRVYCRVQRESR